MGEFNFGLVPAGEYKLLALSMSPGQGLISYNIKPDGVPFSVLHDSLYIRNAFEVSIKHIFQNTLLTCNAQGYKCVTEMRLAVSSIPTPGNEI